MKFNNVFVVDDDKVHHFIIKKLLEKNNIQVSPSFFENGYDALNDLKAKLSNGENPPDLILLDINMPILDGWQFLEEFKEIRKNILNEITICVVSSSEDYFNIDKLEQFKSLIAEYYVKPMTNDVIKTIFTQ
jgi:two-component system chemotaxis response regulator CheY